MYNVSTQLYLDLADKLFEQITTKEFFSGVVTLYDGDIECRLITTLIIERESKPNEEYSFPRITNLVPVWWEFHTFEGDRELLNNFSFSEFREVTL